MAFYTYNTDARKKYLDAMEKLRWEDVVKDRGASFGSIRDVFLHILNAYRYWFQYGIRDNLKGYRGVDRESFKSVDDMRMYERQVDSMVMVLFESLQEEDLPKVYHIHDEDGPLQLTMEAILMHMIEEELQHRGEMNCMFWQQDADPPIVQYHQWLDERRHLRQHASKPTE